MLKVVHRKVSGFVFVIIVLTLALLSSCSLDFLVPPSEDTDTGTLGAVTGRVLFSNSSDHSDIFVCLEKTDGFRALSPERSLAATTSTDQEGYYYFYDLESGFYTLYATHSSSSERSAMKRNIYVDGEEVVVDNLYLTATADIKGRVTIDGSEEGNLGITVFIAGTSCSAITDDSGYFTISDVPLGESYMIAVMKGQYTTVLSYPTTLASTDGMTIDSFDIRSEDLQSLGSLIWKGAYPAAPDNPEKNWAYYNTSDGCSYIYNGRSWDLLARAGKDAVSITWLGSLDTPPENPEKLNAYFNTQTGCSYIFDGSNWTLLCKAGEDGVDGIDGIGGKDGVDGKDGASIRWLGSFASHPMNPEALDAYYNTSDGCSYIYNGRSWDLLARAGKDAVSITWLGSLDTPPENPEKLNAYFNTETGCSYIFDGSNWTLLAQAGEDGVDGIDGIDGKDGVDGKDGASIRWLGSFASHPMNPEALDAYYNTFDGSSYIYTGAEWNLLARGIAHEHTYDAEWTKNENYHWHESTCGHSYAKESMGEHEWDKGTVVTAATCSSTGIMKYTCTVCSAEKTAVIDKLTHEYSVTSTVEPGCTSDGCVIKSCSGCGNEIKTTVLALGHEYGTDNVCDRCGFVKETGHTHSYTTEVIEPLCTQMGYTLHTCQECSDSYRDNIVEPLGHSWDEGAVTTEKTCTTDGVITYRCTRIGCSETREETIPRSHEYEYTVTIPATCTTTGLRSAVCTICGQILSEDPIPASHTWAWDEGTTITQATCSTDGSVLYRCTVCGEEETRVIKAGGHKYCNGVCEVCGHSFIDDVVQDIDYPEYGMYFRLTPIRSAYGDETVNTYGVYLDHNTEAQIDKVGVYLTQDGTMWRRCLAFKGSGITSAYYVPFLSYDSDIFYTGLNSSSINTFRLTKNSDGIYTYGNYTTIGVNLADYTGKLLLTMNHVGQAGAKTRVFSDLDEMIAWLNEGEHTHSFSDWTVTEEATCTKNGTKQRTCSICGEVQTELIAKTEHSFGDWTVTEEATCTKNGTKQRICSVCGEVQSDRIDMIPHTFSSDWTYDVGYHWHSATCGHAYINNGKIEHTFNGWTTVREATSTQAGLMEASCEVCGYKKKKLILNGDVPYVSYTWDSVSNSLSSENLTVGEYTVVTEETTAWTDGWYVVSSDVVISGRITVSGTVNVILCDDVTLLAEVGISLNSGNILNIYGQENGAGELISSSLYYVLNASIGGDDGKSCGAFNMYGGTVTATCRSQGAGIGGGNSGDGGTITIYGGTVTATGVSDGAGLGGGYSGDGGTITIYGGTVTATGGDLGSGIGGGAHGSGGTISVNGGTVTATSRSQGAGIGGGYYSDGGTITINGGTVTATGGRYGAGIGGGSYYGSGGIITINGGIVTATGGSDGAGIGGGYKGAGGTVTINGGSVTATGEDTYGIGAGSNNISNGTLYIDTGMVCAHDDDEVYFTGPGNVTERYKLMKVYPLSSTT